MGGLHSNLVRYSLLLLAIFLAPGLVGAADSATDPWTQENPLRVGVATNLQPASYQLAEGVYGGWGVDMMTLGALKAGVPIQFVPYESVTDGVELLRNGEVDVVGALGTRPDLLEFAVMETPWSWTPVVVMTNANHDWTSQAEARGRISTIAGSPLEQLVESQFSHMDYVSYASPALGVQALANGTIDAYLGPLAIIGHQIQVHQLEGLRPIGEALSIVEVGFWASEPAALETLARIRDSITLDEARLLYVKWTGFDLSEPVETNTGLPQWVGVAAAVLAGIGLIAAAFNFILRKRVREATSEIAELNANLEQQVESQTHDLRRISDRLQTILAASPVGIAVTTPKGVIETSNEALGALLGHAPGELQGKNLDSSSIWAEDAERQEVLAEVRGGKTVRHRVVTLQRKNGAKRQAEVTFDLLDVGGQTLILVTAMDVTDRESAREADVQRKQAVAELEFSRKMQQFAVDLINRTAHQMATPMTPLTIGVTTLKAKLGGGYASDFEILERNIARLRDSLTSIVNAANLQAASLSSGGAHLQVVTLLETAAELHAGMAEEKQIKLNVDAEEARIIGDGSRIQLALGHLLGNALKFTPEAGEVTLRARTHKGRVRLEIEDTGLGISPDQLAKLWMPHEQLGESSLAEAEGSGLGLFVTRRLINLEGGETGCESTEGKGSIFWIELPAVN